MAYLLRNRGDRAESTPDRRTLPPALLAAMVTLKQACRQGLPGLFAWRNVEKGSWELDRFRASYCSSVNPDRARWQI